MKRVIIATILASLVACGVAVSQKKSKPIKLKNDSDSISYVLGSLVGEALNGDVMALIKNHLNSKIFQQAMESAMAGGEMQMDYYEAIAYLTEYGNNLEQKDNADRLERGQKFLAENAKKKGVNISASGLQYRVDQEGNGEEYPDENSFITANIMGMTFDGHVFREVDEDEYFYGYVEELLQGFTEGIMMMSPGAKYTLYLPSELAHGEDGASWKGVKPYDVLVYEVELIEISDYSQYGESIDYEAPRISEDYEYMNTPREAGDYTQLVVRNNESIERREDMHNYHNDMTYAFTIGNHHYIHMGYYDTDGHMAVVDDSGEELQRVLIGSGYWNDGSVGVYEPLNKESKDRTIVMIGDIYNYDRGESSSEVYSQNSDGTLKHIASIPMEIINDDSYYVGEGRLINYMSIHNISGGLRFGFANKNMKYMMDGDFIQLPGEDIYYEYNYADGSFKAGGVAAGLTFFKRQTLKRIVRGVNPEQIDVLAMGDLNADGHIDVLYTRNDDSKIYINLCNDYKIVKKMALSIEPEFTLDRSEPNSVISSRGEINIYIYDNDGYQARKYILKGDKLVETEASKTKALVEVR